MYKLVLLLVFYCSSLFCFSQSKINAWQTNIYLGTLFKHKAEFNAVPYIKKALFADIGICFAKSEKEYAYFFHQPIFSLNAIVESTGNRFVLGKAIGIYGAIDFLLVKAKRHCLVGSYGQGLVVLTKKNNALTNPNNLIMSTWINSLSKFSLQYQYALSQKISLVAKANFLHISNGNVKKPNLGINMPAWSLGIKHTTQQKNTKLEFNNNTPTVYYKKLHFSLEVKEGLGEYNEFPGRPFKTFACTPKLHYFLKKYVAFFTGLEAENNDYLYYYALLTYQDRAGKNLLRTSIQGGVQLLMGHLGIQLTKGHYFHNLGKDGDNYTELDVQYFLKNTNTNANKKLFWGYGIKAMGSVAENSHIKVGYIF
jgi:Lipid A 3-O-deacylase (PagL)